MHFINENTIKLKVSIIKSLGFFFLISIWPSILIYIFIYSDVLTSNIVGLIISSLLILMSFISFLYLISFFINDFSRELIIDLNNKTILVDNKKALEHISYSTNSKIKYVTSKLESGINIIGFFEYIVIDEKIVITNLSANLENLIGLMGFKNIDKRRNWFTFITR